jgi:hypothetical protein
MRLHCDISDAVYNIEDWALNVERPTTRNAIDNPAWVTKNVRRKAFLKVDHTVKVLMLCIASSRRGRPPARAARPRAVECRILNYGIVATEALV